MKYSTSIITLILLILSLLIGQGATADVLTLKNGDRITGDVKRIWDSEITIEPEYSHEFKVDMRAVDHIESERKFEIELEDGRSIVGKFAGMDSSGNQVVTAGEETFSAPLSDFIELNEPEKDFDWESNVEFSAALNSGHTDSNNTKLKANATVKFPDHRHIGEVTYFREEQSGVATQEQDLFKYDYNWLFRDPWFFSAKLSFERHPIMELQSRVILSVGIGCDIWSTPRKELSVQLGAGAQTEEIGLITTESGVMTWSLRCRQGFLSDDLELYHNNSITSNVSGRTNTSYKTTIGLRFKITDLLYANFSVDYDYETHPVDTAENEDVALLVGVGLGF